MFFHALVLAATNQSLLSCGGLGLPYGTTIGISVDNGRQRVSSIVALARIVSSKSDELKLVMASPSPSSRTRTSSP